MSVEGILKDPDTASLYVSYISPLCEIGSALYREFVGLRWVLLLLHFATEACRLNYLGEALVER